MNKQFDELAKGLAQSATRRHKLTKFGLNLAGIAFVCFALANRAEAGSPTFTTIDFPGSAATLANGMAPSGPVVVVGDYVDATGEHGYIFRGGAFTSISFPGAIFTETYAININGVVVGDYAWTNSSGNGTSLHGYVLAGGTFVSLDFPGANFYTQARGINSQGDIVGTYFIRNGVGSGESPLSSGNGHGFLLSGGVYSSIDFPGAILTEAWRISDTGKILGRYKSSTDGSFHMFLFAHGSFSTVPDVPNGIATASSNYSSGGLTEAGDIVGDYSDATPIFKDFKGLGKTSGNLHGFLLSGGVYTTIDFPGANSTGAWGVNSSGYIAGPTSTLTTTAMGI
jgi:hypothetical protein